MPGANIIQKHFGMRASAFLKQYYGLDQDHLPRKNRYGYITTDDWVRCFREQFLKHCHDEGFSSNTYNLLKDKNTPLWMTIARHCGTTQWTKLMQLAGVEYPNKTKTQSITAVTVQSEWLTRIEAAVQERRVLDQQLMAFIDSTRQPKRREGP
jgi:hypothetical protein